MGGKAGMAEHIFIINPRAGRHDQTTRVLEMAAQLRRRHGVECRCLLTERPGHAAELARRAAETGREIRVYACGGDGTVNEAANGLAGFPNAALTAIPIGTGNDFLKNFGPDREKFSDAENLWDGPRFPLDLIDCSGRLCLTIACAGLDARTAADVHRFTSYPMLSGRGSYVAALAANFLFRPITRRWTVVADGRERTGDYALVAVCNGRYYGGGFTPMAEARMDDGVLDTLLVTDAGRLAFARHVGQYSSGRWREVPRFMHGLQPRELVLRSDSEDITVCLDGEIVRGREFCFRLSERKLDFFGPAGCDPNATARPRQDAPQVSGAV